MNSVRKNLVALVGLALLASSHSATAEKLDWRPEETTIAGVHAAMRDGTLTTKQLIEMYLARIEAYDKKGTALNAVILVNPKALEIADDLDAKFKASGPVGPLHGIPVLLKDNVNTADMPPQEDRSASRATSRRMTPTS